MGERETSQWGKRFVLTRQERTCGYVTRTMYVHGRRLNSAATIAGGARAKHKFMARISFFLDPPLGKPTGAHFSAEEASSSERGTTKKKKRTGINHRRRRRESECVCWGSVQNEAIAVCVCIRVKRNVYTRTHSKVLPEPHTDYGQLCRRPSPSGPTHIAHHHR